MARPDRLLDTLAIKAAKMAEKVADLEQRQATLRRDLAIARALRSEILEAADALNRQRRG